MSQNDADREDNTVYKVVVNHEEQYSIWPTYKEIPSGWNDAGKSGAKAECLSYIKEIWSDMRPLSLRKKMEELARNPTPPSQPRSSSEPPERSLVDRLCEGDHPVEPVLRPEKTLKVFKEIIDRKYVHIKFTHTKGGTELGFQLDQERSSVSLGDFENGKGRVHVEGSLMLDYVNVRCIADIDLGTLAGTGRLEKV
jgi:uncharacterized protein YbdZ (MbtH family)